MAGVWLSREGYEMVTPTARGLRFALALVVATLMSTAGRSLAQTPEPPKLAGTWTWSWNDRLGEVHRHILEVEGVGTKLAARELFDDLPAVKVSNLTLNGTSIRFTVVRDARKADYNGKVADADHINGTVTVNTGEGSQEFGWKAERRKGVPK
jgi:hypothetical protein